MNRWRILLLLIVILALALAQPKRSWTTLEKYWGQRNWILSVVVAVVVLYLLYGLYSFYRQGGLGAY